MSENYHEFSFLTLGSLPSDIIRIILQVNGHPQYSLRLVSINNTVHCKDSAFQISSTWNAMVIDHLSYRRNHLSLKFVQFSGVSGTILRDVKVNMIVASESFTQSDVSRRVFSGWTSSNPSERVSLFSMSFWPGRFKYSGQTEINEHQFFKQFIKRFFSVNCIRISLDKGSSDGIF